VTDVRESTKYPTWRWLVAIAALVIGFLLSKGYDISIANNLSQDTNYKELRVSQQAVSERVTRLESGYEYIAAGIKELKIGQKEMIDGLALHERKAK
jgi:hypothetical protein